MDTTLSPQLFGPKNVLVRYRDRNCRNPTSGQGSTQSWTRVVGPKGCYEITTGMLCFFRCIVKLTCQYDTGSGVLINEMEDLSCKGAPKNTKPFAQDLYWMQAQNLFEGGCEPDGTGYYVRFEKPLDREHWPDCGRYGAVAPGEDASAQLFEATYTLQFYSDLECAEEYVVDAYSDRPTSRFSWKLYRGVQYCYDMVDATPRSNLSARPTNFDILNWRMVCGNLDSIGNGIMIQGYVGPKCTGGSTGAESWMNVFFPMNYPALIRFLQGGCTLWGKYRVKFDRALDPMHFPDCYDWACRRGACAGGRIRDAADKTGSVYSGDIKTSGGDPADARSLDPKAKSPAARCQPLTILVAAAVLPWAAFMLKGAEG